ncbi:unnamed protein product [Closterium sp. NIES-53]
MYAPLSSCVMMRIFLSIVAVLDLNLLQLDMKNAFLQSKLERVLYMYQPGYYNDETGRVCKLLMSLYGLKHSSLLWYKALNDVLVGAGWKKCQVDGALYFKVDDNGVACWVLVYVDDLLGVSSSTAMLKELLEAAFELREISPVEKYLGLEIVHDRPARKLWTPVSVDSYAELTFNEEEAQEHQEEEYRQKAGSLQFAATTTRPDIAFACSKLGGGLTARSDQHWREVDRCFAYLANTRDTALEFGGGQEMLELVGYVKAGDAGNKQNRTSTGCYSEYVAATEASKEGRHLCFLLAEFRLLDAKTPSVLRVDNKSAITVAEGLGLQGNLKHMERRYAWVQHMVRHRKFTLKYIPTTEQPADFLTKALHYPTFNRCSIAIGQVRLADVSDANDDVQQCSRLAAVGDADFGELVDGCGRPARGHCQAADFGTLAADIYEWSTMGSSTRRRPWVADDLAKSVAQSPCGRRKEADLVASTWFPDRPSYPGDRVPRRCATVAQAVLAKPTLVWYPEFDVEDQV